MVFITTSKNASRDQIRFAKEICSFLPNSHYISRGKRSLSDLLNYCEKFGNSYATNSSAMSNVFVLFSNSSIKTNPNQDFVSNISKKGFGNFFLMRYSKNPDGSCYWSEDILQIHGFNVKSKNPLKISRKNKHSVWQSSCLTLARDSNAKKLACFLGYNLSKIDSPLCCCPSKLSIDSTSDGAFELVSNSESHQSILVLFADFISTKKNKADQKISKTDLKLVHLSSFSSFDSAKHAKSILSIQLSGIEGANISIQQKDRFLSAHIIGNDISSIKAAQFGASRLCQMLNKLDEL